jgi:uncharacterized membrane protein YjjB (DUF3815 family)
VDGGWSFLFGFIIYVLDVLSGRLSGLNEIVCFVSSFIVSAIATALDTYVYDRKLCLFGQLFGGVVWLLPGITITIGLLEIYSGMTTYGSARLVYGVTVASQIGFGLSLGYMLLSRSDSIPQSFIDGCKPENSLPIECCIILIPMAAACMAIIIRSSLRQLPGMMLTASIGFLTSYITTNSGAGPSSSFIAAMMVTISARLYAYFDGNQRPFTYIVAGLLVLVPGSVAVRGMSNMWSGNSQAGFEFTFRMLLIAVCLAIGVFIALIPSKKWFIVSIERNTSLASQEGDFSPIGDIHLVFMNPMTRERRLTRVSTE